MIPGIVASGGADVAPVERVLSTTNLLQTATRTATGQGPDNWNTFNASLVTDGITNNNAGVSLDSNPSNNNGRGFSFTFDRPVRLGRFRLWRYNYPFNWVIQYWDGAAWQTVDTLANTTGASPRDLDFNPNGDIAAAQWRLYLADWPNPGDNMYVFEVGGYEWE